jgi:glycine/D-amino acid oxidase-like deaminating enzyme
MTTVDVAVVGGGVMGTAAAWFLAEAGSSVLLLERDELAAGASGRNSGSIQRPFDAVLAGLHRETLTIYRRLSEASRSGPTEDGFLLPDDPAGLLLLGPDAEAIEGLVAVVSRDHTELEPTFFGPDDLARAEPALARGLAACRLETGYPVRPWSATRAFGRAAEAAGASIRLGSEVRLERAGRALRIRTSSGQDVAAGSIVVAAGPWTPQLIDPGGSWSPIRRTWGVTVAIELEERPRAVLEEVGTETLGADEVPTLFSLVTADGASVVGSTFLDREPDAAGLAPQLLERATVFVPGIAGAAVTEIRRCARPQSIDGRPLVGGVPGLENVFVAAGHGPWGISTGPATARMVADLVLGRDAGVPAELDPARFGSPY